MKTTTICVITCHNLAKFLPACLFSVVNQTRKFDKIILIDDASHDDPEPIVQRFPAIEYRRVNFLDKHEARSSVELSGYDFVLFVDADNWLDENFHEATLRGMEHHKTGLVFTEIAKHDEAGLYTGSMYGKSHGTTDIRDNNFIDVCSLMRVEAFLQVGGWCDRGDWQMEDWRVALRMRQMGWNLWRVADTSLNYRVRGERMEERKTRMAEITLNVRWEVFRYAIVRPFCGRDCAVESITKVNYPSNSHVFIVAARHAHVDETNEFVRQHYINGISCSVIFHDFGVTNTHATEREPEEFNRHLSKVFAWAASMVPDSFDYVLTWEDDVLPERRDAILQLTKTLNEHAFACVASAVPVRTRPDRPDSEWNKKILCFRGPGEPMEHCAGVREVNYLTFCLTLFRRAAWDNIAWRPNTGIEKGHWANDFAACMDARMSRHSYGKQLGIGVDGDVTCGHYDGVRVLTLKQA